LKFAKKFFGVFLSKRVFHILFLDEKIEICRYRLKYKELCIFAFNILISIILKYLLKSAEHAR